MRRSRSPSCNFSEMPRTGPRYQWNCLRPCRLDRFDRVVITTKALQHLHCQDNAPAWGSRPPSVFCFSGWHYAPTQARLPRKRQVLRHDVRMDLISQHVASTSPHSSFSTVRVIRHLLPPGHSPSGGARLLSDREDMLVAPPILSECLFLRIGETVHWPAFVMPAAA